MKNHIPKLLSVLLLILIANSSFAYSPSQKPAPFKTHYKKRSNSGFSIINNTGASFVSVVISGLDDSGVAKTQTIYGIADGNSDYFDFYTDGPLHSVAVTITTSSPAIYAFDVRTPAYGQIYAVINYSASPRTFYIPDNQNEEIVIDCYREDY